MGIFDFLRREAKESRTGAILVQNGSQAVWTPRDYESFAKEGYQQNVIAYQAINKIAEAVGGIQWTAWKGKDELVTSPILDLLAKPNANQTGYELLHNIVGYMMISGNAYFERVKVGGRTKELYALRPDRMKVIPSDNGMARGYVYTVGSRSIAFDVDDKGVSDIAHIKLFNPTHDFYGMAPIEAGSFAIDQHNEAMMWMQALLQNSARPSGALQTQSDATLTDDQFKRLKTQIEEQYSGSANAGKPMLLEGGLTWQSMGLSPTDMAIIEAKYSAARDISLAFGVPPQLLNIPGDNTYSNYEQARLAFYEDTVLPIVEKIKGTLTNWLGDELGGIDIRPDLDQIPAIAEKRLTLWQMADASNDLTINERRAIKGYEPIDGGDVVLVNAGLISLGDAAAPLNLEGENLDAKTLARLAGYDPKAG